MTRCKTAKAVVKPFILAEAIKMLRTFSILTAGAVVRIEKVLGDLNGEMAEQIN